MKSFPNFEVNGLKHIGKPSSVGGDQKSWVFCLKTQYDHDMIMGIFAKDIGKVKSKKQ